MVITMDSYPNDSSLPAKFNFEIRNCRDNDLIGIEEIEKSSFDDPYPLSLFRRFLKEFPKGFRVAVSNGEIIGYCILIPSEVGTDSFLLASIAVDARLRARGIGTKLVEDGFSICRASGARSITLQVRVNNDIAISLYSKLGFRDEGVIQGYYGIGKDALEMKINL